MVCIIYNLFPYQYRELVRDAVEYQEFTIVACYRRLVIGCALMNMDRYIMYLAVRPGWQRSGVAQYMLYHLTQTGIELDITLHVSATNPAMVMLSVSMQMRMCS